MLFVPVRFAPVRLLGLMPATKCRCAIKDVVKCLLRKKTDSQCCNVTSNLPD